MAEIVAAMAMTHSPGLTGWFDRAPEDQRLQARRALDEMRERLQAARPDVVVLFSNDHLLNWPINNTPEYTVGIGPQHVGPADWYDEWLALAKYRIPGHPALARYLVNEGARRRLAFAYLRDMQFDDGVSVPMHYLNPDGSIPLVPVTMNCTLPPIPTPERAYQVGTTLREMVRAYPGTERVAVLATGGLSHEPGGPRYFWVDEEFDRWFLDLLKQGGLRRLGDRRHGEAADEMDRRPQLRNAAVEARDVGLLAQALALHEPHAGVAAQRKALGLGGDHIGDMADRPCFDERADEGGPERAGPAGDDHIPLAIVHVRAPLRLAAGASSPRLRLMQDARGAIVQLDHVLFVLSRPSR